MAKCFIHEQPIRHRKRTTKNDYWYATYDASNNKIITNDAKAYNSPSDFAMHHNGKSSNGWAECECYINGQWIIIFNIPELKQTSRTQEHQ
jgi:hypothetical protein